MSCPIKNKDWFRMSLNFSSAYAKDFIRENDTKGLLGQIADAHKKINQKSGLGNDFLGWVDLPYNYDKEEFARIKAAAAPYLVKKPGARHRCSYSYRYRRLIFRRPCRY